MSKKESESISSVSAVGKPGIEEQHDDVPEITLREHHAFSQFVLGSKVKPIPKTRSESVHDRSNFLSRATWAYIGPLLRTGYTRILEINDVWKLGDKGKIEHRMRDFERKLESYKSGPRKSYQEFRAMAYALRYDFSAAIVTQAFYIGAMLSMVVMSHELINEVEKIYYNLTTSKGRGAGLAVGNSALGVAVMWLMLWSQFRTRYLAERCRTILIAASYKKMLRLSPTGRQQFPASKITALITTDTNRIFVAARMTVNLIMFPFALLSVLGMLIHFIGVVSAFSGFGLVVLGVFATGAFSQLNTVYRRKSLPFADKRIAAVRETVENIRVIKFYGWEVSFEKMISAARLSESHFLKILSLVEGATISTLAAIPGLAGALAFGVRTAMDSKLEPAKVFPALTLFDLFIPFIIWLSMGMSTHFDAWASLVRLDEYFRADEERSFVERADLNEVALTVDGTFQWEGIAPTEEEEKKIKKRNRYRFWRTKKIDEAAILPDNCSVKGGGNLTLEKTAAVDAESIVEQEEDEFVEKQSLERAGARKFPGLVDIKLEVLKGELIMIVGVIGSGKTTLLSTLLGLTSKQRGSVLVDGTVSSVLSNWSQNASIRSNILFGKPYDPDRYAKVVRVCNLETDFSSFSQRDFSEVGERGITLSGGQKARVALARCVYDDGDIVLLDDVLSAVDGKVSNHIFNQCILSYLKNKTRIMSTHNLKLLKKADRVVYLPGDGSIDFGTLPDLLSRNEAFESMYSASIKGEDQEPPKDGDKIDQVTTAELDSVQRLSSRADGLHGDAKIMEEEKRNRGRVTSDILRYYLSSGSNLGMWFLLVPLFFLCTFSVGITMQTAWLNFWTSDRYGLVSGVYLAIYCVFILSYIFSYVFAAISLSVFVFNSSSVLHNDAIKNLYRAPLSYFDTTPLGRIINRFTDDVANLDTVLFSLTVQVFMGILNVVGPLILVFVYTPYTMLTVIPVIVFAVIFVSYYRNSARELKRINSLFRSRMFTIVTESVSGLSTIVSYGREDFFTKDLYERIDDMNVSFQVNLASQFWMALRIVFSTVPVGFLTVMLAVFQVFDLSPSNIGAILTVMPNVTDNLALTLPMIAELENEMNSVERLYELGHEIPQEAPRHIEETKPPDSWPDKGEILFKKVSLRYRPNLPVVLKGLNLNIRGGQKVGICGRTGAGKSTILSALFRMPELDQGSIVIDNVDIATIGLDDLRRRLSIIPQEPVLFQGTIRFNIDPFGDHSDLELWDALRRSGVVRENEITNGESSKDHKFHLDAEVKDGGSNLSLGERQLLTLARALVRQSKVIVLDEATATVDLETDKMVQATINKEFADCTIMCIAHRLQTIVNYDLVIIMEDGEALETGNPRELFDNSASRFHAMCMESKVTESDFTGFA